MASTYERSEIPLPLAWTSTVDIVVPVHNEERVLDGSIRRLRSYLDDRFPFATTVTIADSASTDRTWEVASRLAAQHLGIRAVHLTQKGRGRALRSVWEASEAPVVAYMDVDLATDLDALLPLVAPLLSGHSDLAIGSRLAHGARVERGPKREVISRLYNLVVRTAMRNSFTDAQCGFKAMRADAARTLLPLVSDEGWFFDTELLVLAEHNGMRIHEVPVDWVDDPDSRVELVSTAIRDLAGLWRVACRLATGGGRAPAVTATAATGRYAGIRGMSTIAYLAGLLAIRPATGVLAANAIALTFAAAANFAAHWRCTRPERGSPQRRAYGADAATALAVGLALSTVALAIASQITSSLVADLVVVIAANAVVSVGRFVSLRARMFRQTRAVPIAFPPPGKKTP